MQVNLEPSANLAAGSRSASGERGGGGGGKDGAAPTKHKPLLQARRNQYEDYRNLKDRDFLSIHEEVTHLRQSTRDQERIIALLKEEKSRVLAELLQKGKDVQHLKDLLKRPQSADGKSQLDEARRALAERECTIDELKSEIVRINGVHQRTLEDYDDIVSSLREMEQRVFNAEQQTEHKQAEVERLEESIRLLNEEMTARLNNMGKTFEQAVEVGKRDATTDHHLLEEELLIWKGKVADAQKELKRFQDEEQRHRELSLKQQAAANEAVADKVHLLAELRRQQQLLTEVEELKAQIEAFRVTQATSEDVLRQQLNVALLNIHEEKDISRKLMAEVDKKEDTIAAKDREIARMTRDYEKKLLEAAATKDNSQQHRLDELEHLLKSAKQDNILLSEQASKATLKLEQQQSKVKELEAQNETLKSEIQRGQTERSQLVTRTRDLEDAVAQAQRSLSLAANDVEHARTVHARLAEDWPREREELIRAHTRREEQLIAEKEALETATTDAVAHITSLNAQISALREAQTEHDMVRHEALAVELQEARDKIEELEEALETAVREVEKKHSELSARDMSELTKIDAEVTEKATLHRLLEEKDAALMALREESSNALAQCEERWKGELAEALAAKNAAPSGTDAADKRVEKLEKEKKQLQEKLKMSELAKDDAEKSLDIRSQQLRKESELRSEAAKALQAAKEEAAKATQDHQNAIRALVAANEEFQEKLTVHERSSADTIASLKELLSRSQDENERMKQMQLHW